MMGPSGHDFSEETTAGRRALERMQRGEQIREPVQRGLLTVTPPFVVVRVSVLVVMIVTMPLRVIMMMVMQVRLAARQSRVFAEHQGFDGYRHRHRRQPDTAEID